jgi:hypothetical protein
MELFASIKRRLFCFNPSFLPITKKDSTQNFFTRALSMDGMHQISAPDATESMEP